MERKSTTTGSSWRIRQAKYTPVCLLAAFFVCASLPVLSQSVDKAPGSSAQSASAAKTPPAEPASAGRRLASGVAADSPRARLSADCATLLKLAKELKTEMKKVGPDTLSVSVIRKSQAIRKLAYKIQKEMKGLVGKE